MADPLWINANAGAPEYSANELRQAMGLALMYDGRNMGGRSGVRPGGNQLLTSLAGSTITVQPGLACVDPGLTTPQGPYWVAIPAAETHTLTAAHATLPRKDITVLRIYDHDEDASGLRLGRTEYLVGTPNASPSEPAVPAGAVRLATIDVPASPGAASVTDRRPWTVSPGGILPVSGASDISAAVEGRYRDRLDTNLLERDSGAAWETVADPQMFKAWTVWVPTLTNLTLGAGGAVVARYRQVGKTVDFVFKFTLGAGSAVASNPTFTLPATAASHYTSNTIPVGDGLLLDAGLASRHGLALTSGGTTATIYYLDQATGAPDADVTPTLPWTWGSGDSLSVAGTYEAA